MAFSTILGLTVGLAALFFYIEEKKFEALYYQTELSKLQQQNGFNQLMQQIALQSNNTAIQTLHKSIQVQTMSAEQASQLVNDLKAGRQPDSKLTNAEISAINSLAEQ